MIEFKKHPGQACLSFTNVPPENVAWVPTLKCQVITDIPGAPDEFRSPVVRHGETFVISQLHWRDRVYYVAPWLARPGCARSRRLRSHLYYCPRSRMSK